MHEWREITTELKLQCTSSVPHTEASPDLVPMMFALNLKLLC